MSRLPVPGIAIESQPDDILAAMLVWGEARGESPAGKLAVIWVAVNRALKSGRALRWEILRNSGGPNPIYQFSCFAMDDPNRAKMLAPLEHDRPQVWDLCWEAAQLALKGEGPDPTHGATHYCVEALWNQETKPGYRVQWYHRIEIEAGRTVETARIGHHVFARAA